MASHTKRHLFSHWGHISKRFKYLGSYPSPEFPVLNTRNILREEFNFFNFCLLARYGMTGCALDRKTKNYFLHTHTHTHTHTQYVTLSRFNVTKHNCTKSPPLEPTAIYLSAYLACPLHNHCTYSFPVYSISSHTKYH